MPLDRDLLDLGVVLDDLADVVQKREALFFDDGLIDLELNLLFEVDLVVAQLDPRRRLGGLFFHHGRWRRRRGRRASYREWLYPRELCDTTAARDAEQRSGNDVKQRTITDHGLAPP